MSHFSVLSEFEKSSDRTETKTYFRGIWSNDTPGECDEEVQNEFINVPEENLEGSSVTFPNEIPNDYNLTKMTLSNNVAHDFEDDSIIPKNVEKTCKKSSFICSENPQETDMTFKNENYHGSSKKTEHQNDENKDKKELTKRTDKKDIEKKKNKKDPTSHSENSSKHAFSNMDLNQLDFETDATDFFDSEDEYFETYRSNIKSDSIFAFHGMIHSPSTTPPESGRYSKGVSQYNNMPVFVNSLQKFAKANGFTVHDVMADGNCLFRAIDDQLAVNGIFGNSPDSLRKNALKFLRENPYQEDGSHTESFLFTENWEQYLFRMEQNTEWCDHVILKAAVDALGLHAVVFNVYRDDIRRTEVLCRNPSDGNITVYLGHFGEFHYLSLRPENWEKEWQYKALMFRQQLLTRQIESIQSNERNGLKDFHRIKSNCGLRTEMKGDRKHSDLKNFGYTVCPVYGLKDLDMEENEESLHRLVEDPFYIDTRTGLPLQHLTYLIKHLIPPMMNLVNSYALPPIQKDGIMFQYIGSFATGTYVFLKDITRGYTLRNKVKKDATVVALRPLTSAILFDTKDTHPGYLRLKILSSLHTFPEKSLYRNEDSVFLKRLDAPDEMSLPERSERCFTGFSSGELPPAVEEWRNRRRKFQWPSHNVIAAIHNAGCTIIPKHHPKSCNPEIEWKFNFSSSEVVIFECGLTEKQLRGFDVLQILIEHSTCHFGRGLKLKHTKAIFFNCCEQIPVKAWETNFSGCILYAIAFLSTCLRKKNLPHYFIQSCNLIENYTEVDLEAILIQIEAIRVFPVQTIQYLAENYGYTYGANLSRFILQDCRRFASNRDILSTYHDVFVPGTIRTIKFLTRQGYYEAAFYLLLDTYEVHLCSIYAKPNDLNFNFAEFFCSALGEIQQEATKTILAKKFENKYGMNILNSVMNTDGLFVKDILPWEVNYHIANLHIPMEKTSSFESVGEFFYKFSKTEVRRLNSYLAELGISEAIQCFDRAILDGTMIDIEIDDEALKKDIQSQKSKNTKRLKEKLRDCYLHTFCISKMESKYQPLDMYMPAIEELCKEFPEMSGVVSHMYGYLRRPSKQREYEQYFDSFLGTGEVYKGSSKLKK
ncbi:uncharacterized protein LOC133204619 [Saccostrea echinata]|uniref:uncharacterized protein LOC133204619 n=1 Tax=Saccostrea echinata TaxID=191078 RepID=UPI002A810139|nr:uncharacterized protein LOC133204619 [Saccostrea echinata]